MEAQDQPQEKPKEQPQDIYPLGLGHGALVDLLNFGLNNLYQYGQGAAQKGQQMNSLFEAMRSGQSADPQAMRSLTDLAMNINPVMGMAKAFKPAPDTLEGLITSLAKQGAGIGSRRSLLPAIRKEQEIFASGIGETHPTDLVNSIMTQRGLPAGGYEYGFQVPGQPHFIPESLAHVLAFPEGVTKVHGMLQKGLNMDSILGALRYASERGQEFGSPTSLKSGGY